MSPSPRTSHVLPGLKLFPCFLLACTLCLSTAHAQARESTLSDAEVEQLRESAYEPAERIAVFIKLLDARAANIQALVAKPRRPGREDDLHDMLEQFASIVDELNDNLDDYGPRHRDLRKQLPKLMQATYRWATALRSPAESDAYKAARDIALEGVRDVHTETARLIEEQKVWFTAHPPTKEPSQTPTLEDRR